MMRPILVLLICALLGSSTLVPRTAAGADTTSATIELLPTLIRLSGAKSSQRLIVVQRSDDGASDQRTTAAAAGPSTALPGPLVKGPLEWTSSSPEVAIVEDGVVYPRGDGEARLRVTTAEGQSAECDVVVEGFDRPAAWSFRNDVEAILARRGCSMGACHGALAGKGGFRLSLRGYDPRADYLSIAREALGRRLEPADPGRSLLLAKPTGALPHKGGIRLQVEDRDYQILADWISQGATPPREDDPRLTRIEVIPENSRLVRGDQTQILVRAHYADGRLVDVTDWAKFSATDESIAGVDDRGQVLIRGSGQGALLVWFGSKVALARLTVPYPYEIPAEVYADSPRRNFIDDLVLAQLQTLQLKPSSRCSDEAFIRRATIDTIGRLPKLEETTAFLASTDVDKRDRLIEALLASQDFDDYWAYKWSDLLLVSGERLRPDGVKAYYQWIRRAVAENLPWDELVRKILMATGSSLENGATNFYALHQDPENLTENAAQAFLGLSIGCAKCHNHPLEKWTNDQYYAMANLFARVRGKGWGGDSRSGDGNRTIYVSQTGDLLQPSTGKPQPPAPLDAPALPIDDPEDRRKALADWMVSPGNPYFSRAITNRIWKNYFGIALVEEPDDLRLSNPASNEPLLEAAAQYLVDQQFDLKRLMRTILQSETYQRSSVPLAENEAELRYYSRYYPRRMMAEVLLDQIDQALGTSTPFDTIAFPGADRAKTDFYPPGTRAIQLYDSAIESYFLTAFGRNSREITCECQRSTEPSMVQVLHLSNGNTLNEKLAATENRIARWLQSGLSDAEIVDEFFLIALCRKASSAERERLVSVIAEYGAEQRRQAIEDACWSVLTSSEFIFNQ